MASHKLTYIHPSKLRAYERNAKQHSQEQVLQIAESIRLYGFTNPILADKGLEVIAGHGRLDAAIHLGLDKVPVIVLEHLTSEQAKALRLADNRISQNSTWNMELLEAELRHLADLDVDVSKLGFSTAELDRMLREAEAIIPTVNQAPVQHVPVPSTNEVPWDNTPEPRAVWTEPEQPQSAPAPKASDDQYSKFELVMEHTNKVALVEVLDRIKTKYAYEKNEEALMHMVRWFNQEGE